jgi:GAF domain-containing protein
MRRLLSSKGSFHDILDQTLRSAVKSLHPQAQMGSIYLYDRATGQLTIHSHTGYPLEVRQEARFLPGKGLAGYVYKTGRLWNVRDTQNDPRYRRLSKAPDRVRSTIGVPLRGRGGIQGVLCLDNLKRSDAFTAESEKLLTLFAGEVAPWLENARLVEILRDLHATVIDLLDLSSPAAQTLFETVAKRLVHNFGLNGCAIGLRESPQMLHLIVRHGLSELPELVELQDLPPRLQHDTLAEGRPFIIADLHHESDGWHRLLNRTDLTTLIALPLRADHEQHGVMLLASVGEFIPTDEEFNLLLTFANQVAVALENTSLYGQVHGELREKIAELEQAQRRLEVAARQQLQIRNARLATGLLHQINNAVANIPDLANEVSTEIHKEAGPLSALKPLGELQLNAERVSHISRWLHQFVRLGNLKLEPVDLATAIIEAHRQLDHHWPLHVAEPEIHSAPDAKRVRADRALMEILFQNLLRNACEAIPVQRVGRVIVNITREGDECLIRISDNGLGIGPELQETIWQWGFTTKSLEGATHDRGLGLFACRQIVEGHAGTICVERSELNEGSTFLVRLPIAGPGESFGEA